MLPKDLFSQTMTESEDKGKQKLLKRAKTTIICILAYALVSQLGEKEGPNTDKIF